MVLVLKLFNIIFIRCIDCFCIVCRPHVDLVQGVPAANIHQLHDPCFNFLGLSFIKKRLAKTSVK